MTPKEQKEQAKQQAEQMEQMRTQVQELELRARYWKAQHDIRFFTLESEKLQPEYNEFLEKAAEEQRVQLERFEQVMKEKMENEGNLQVTEEMIEANPELATQGIEPGDEIPNSSQL